MKKFLLTIALSISIFFSQLQAVYAVDAWTAAAQAAGVYALYRSTLVSMTKLGNDVNAQIAVRRQDIKANGQDFNRLDVQLVNSIMTRLINNANYELRVNSLPFVWLVNNSEKFNAACYPMNYISINRGLLRTLNLNADEIAAVLAHEMTHGIEQHSAKNYAKAMAQMLGAMMIGMDVGSSTDSNIDWSKFNGIVGYSVAKTITLPSEQEADEGGFYLMTQAGFNPGGGAAAMARMDYYVRYETEDLFEFDAHDKPEEQTMSDHPDTTVRENNLSKMLTEYSLNHVRVEKSDRIYKVYIDDTEIFTAQVAGEIYRSAELAYLFAGGLSKAFHDYKNFADWNFRTGDFDRITFLTNDDVYKILLEENFNLNLGEKIQTAVQNAYQTEPATLRQNFQIQETERLSAWQKIKSDALNSSKKAAKQLRLNADTYNDYGQAELALFEIERAMQATNQDDLAQCFAIRGRAKAILGDYDGALADVNKAVEMDNKNLYNFLNRADVFHMRGELDLALADIATAINLDKKNAVAFRLQGDIFDELGEIEKATESYRTCYNLTKKNAKSIPLDYLEKIDSDAAEKIRKENPSTGD